MKTTPCGNQPAINANKLTLGIPCRDDGQDLSQLADGLNAALDMLPPSVQWEGIIAVNGSSESFLSEVERLFSSNPVGRHGWRVIRSELGKLNAQRAIVEARRLDGYLVFADADVLLEPPVLRLLLETMEDDEGCMVAYAQPVPVFPSSPNPLHRLMRVHYALRERCYQRRFFHGRTFMLREWFWEHPHTSADATCPVGRRLALDAGPLVDDIALSRMAVARWGPAAIREVRAANVHFDPPDTIPGLYAGALRNAFEIARLDRLYPGHAVIQRELFQPCWEASGLRRFSWRLRLAHGLWRSLESAIKIVARNHIRLVKAGLLPTLSQWIPVPGTKSLARKPRRCHVTSEAGRLSPQSPPASVP